MSSNEDPVTAATRAKKFVSDKASVATGMIEKSIIGSILTLASDVVTPLANLSPYLAIFFFVLSVVIFLIWKIKKLDSCKRYLAYSVTFSAFLLAFSAYQLLDPNSKKTGVLASKVPAITQFQQYVGLVDAKLDRIASTVDQIAVGTQEIEKNTAQTVDELKNIGESIRKMGTTEGVISNPKSPSEIYHNARIFSQRGEIDNAVKFYKQFFKASSLSFIDAVTDYADLQKRMLGNRGAVRAIGNDTELPEQSKMIAKVYLEDSIDLLAAQIEMDPDLDSAFHIIYMQTLFEKFMPSRLPRSKTLEVAENQLTHLQYSSFMVAHGRLKKHVDDGSYRNYFIDNYKATKIENIFDAVNSSMYEERKYLSDFPVAIQYRTRDFRIFFRDYIDLKKPAKVCGQIIKKLDKQLGLTLGGLRAIEREALKTLLSLSKDSRKIGIKVLGVLPESPAMKAGILEGDIVLSYRDELVQEASNGGMTWDTWLEIQNSPVGLPQPIDVIRAGARIQFFIQLRNGHEKGEDKCFDYFDKSSWLIDPERDTPEAWFISDKNGWLRQVPMEAAFQLKEANGMFCVQSVSYTDINGMPRSINRFDIWWRLASTVAPWNTIDEIAEKNSGSLREIETCKNFAAEDGERKPL